MNKDNSFQSEFGEYRHATVTLIGQINRELEYRAKHKASCLPDAYLYKLTTAFVDKFEGE